MRLGVDFGTSTTVAMLQRADGSVTPLLFDASPLLPSGVFAGPDALLTGADADRAAVAHPARYEPNPKRRIDDGTAWLDERELPIAELVAAVLTRVAEEARRVAGRVPDTLVLTHPATWSRPRLAVLADAARRIGFGAVDFVAEPVAAAAYFATVLGRELPPGRCLVVYDLGAGTFDVTVVRRSEAGGAGGFEVVAADGLADVGGLDLDAAVVQHARSLTADGAAAEAWGRLDWPETPADQRARRVLWQGARAAKEQLSRHVAADLHVPLAEAELHMTREEFEKAARPHLDRTVALTVGILRASGVPGERIGGVFLVGGSSRVPLAATLLHRTLRIAPTTIDQPELVVAMGSLYTGSAPSSPPIVETPPPPRVVARAAVPAAPEPVTLAGVALNDPVAVRALRVLSCYGLAPLPVDVLAPLAPAAAVDAAVRLLVSNGLVTRALDTVIIRPPVRASIMEQLSSGTAQAGLADVLRTATGLLRRAAPPGEPRRVVSGWPRWAALRPHITALAAVCPDAVGGADLAWLLDQAGQYEMVHGRNRQALADHRRALEVTEAVLGPDHADAAPRADHLAGAMRAVGQYAEVEALSRRALSISEATLGPAHAETARRMAGVALALRTLGRAAEAEPLQRRALAISEAALGPHDPDVANRLVGLAFTLRLLGREAEAEPIARRALAIDEAALGPDHQGVAEDLGTLADILRGLNRPTEAEPLIRRALAIDEAVFGNEDHQLSFRYGGLAATVWQRGRPEDAEPLYRRAIELADSAVGAPGPDIGAWLASLAQLLTVLGRPAEAEPFARRALAFEEKLRGDPDHPDVGDRLAALADTLRGLGRDREALPLFQRALAITERSYRKDHPDLAARLAGLAGALRAVDLPEAAEPLFARAAAVAERAFGAEHADVGVWLSEQAGCLRELGRAAEAEPVHRRALAIFEGALGRDHPDTAAHLHNLAVSAARARAAQGGRGAAAPRAGDRRVRARVRPPHHEHDPRGSRGALELAGQAPFCR
ncbi:tetratricopeptide repeat protein [Dactylosporangium darangshiense]|uniref:tetratricopeptide repeat protein n=1 Tax=Dactylosporangium darangshiense TaxID=579108 RepID=UPI00363F08FF